VGTLQAIRRRLLNNLSYIGDCEKGGATTTSVALEECHDCFKFWVASNNSSGKITKFVEMALSDVTGMSGLPPQQREPEELQFVRKCVTFAKSRITKEAKILYRKIEKCTKMLTSDNASAG
jgi:hypothetical protein